MTDAKTPMADGASHARKPLRFADTPQQPNTSSTFTMLYEMIGVVRPGRLSEVKEYLSLPRPPHAHSNTSTRIAKTAGTIILSSSGVVRGYSNWGTFLLPKPAKKLQSTHHYGHHFIMRFDASAKAQHALRRTMSLDPRLIRYSVVKMGEKFEDIKDVGGVAKFR
jgi:small subunit ribosomal protein S6